MFIFVLRMLKLADFLILILIYFQKYQYIKILRYITILILSNNWKAQYLE